LGGDSSAVQAELKDVETIYSTDYAFAAKLKNGNLVTWGDTYGGGDPGSVSMHVTKVDNVYPSKNVFVGTRSGNSGQAIVWGNPLCGGRQRNKKDAFKLSQGDNGTTKAILTNVKAVISTNYAVAAILKNGAILTWGILK